MISMIVNLSLQRKMPKDTQIKFDLGWGNPYFLLQVLEKVYKQPLSPHDISGMSYSEDYGVKELREATQKAINDTSGIQYDYILIVNGATHGINIALKYMQQKGYRNVITRRYGYPFYENMIKNAGLKRKVGLNSSKEKTDFVLIDSPSNPEGIQSNLECAIWDSVYHNQIYTSDLNIKPTHAVNIGSYSKLLGLTGARVGWIATNNPLLFHNLADIALYDTATVSMPSQKLIIDILNKIKLDEFMKQGRGSLSLNKEELYKISYIFDRQPIPETGMFYCVFAHPKAIKLLEECGINYVRLEDNFIRLNIGQTNEIIKTAVQTILKKDKKIK